VGNICHRKNERIVELALVTRKYMVLIVLQALLNLCSFDASLRSAAYNLLCTLTWIFVLKIEGQLLDTAGMLI